MTNGNGKTIFIPIVVHGLAAAAVLAAGVLAKGVVVNQLDRTLMILLLPSGALVTAGYWLTKKLWPFLILAGAAALICYGLSRTPYEGNWMRVYLGLCGAVYGLAYFASALLSIVIRQNSES